MTNLRFVTGSGIVIDGVDGIEPPGPISIIPDPIPA